MCDTAFPEKNNTIAPMYYRGAKIAIFCISVTNTNFSAFKEKMTPCANECIKHNIPLLLTGGDIEDKERCILYVEEAKSFADMIKATDYLEFSSKERAKIDYIFEIAARIVLKSKQLLSQRPIP